MHNSNNKVNGKTGNSGDRHRERRELGGEMWKGKKGGRRERKRKRKKGARRGVVREARRGVVREARRGVVREVTKEETRLT